MAKYRINVHELTGVKGKTLYKNQVVNEAELVEGSVEHLKSIKAISEVTAVAKPDIPVEEIKKDSSKKASKKDKKPE